MLKKYSIASIFIIVMECAERYSFFAFKCILIPFSINILKTPDYIAKIILHTIVACVFLLPIVSGYLIDKGKNKINIIIFSCFLAMMGHLVLIKADVFLIFLFGLLTLSVATGLLKTTIVSLLSDQEGDKHAILENFYVSSNVSILISIILTPIIFRSIGHHASFTMSAIMMGISTIIFLLGLKHYKHSSKKSEINFFQLISAIFSKTKKNLTKIELRAVIDLKKNKNLLLSMVLYYTLYEHVNSVWVIQAMNLNQSIFGIKIFPEQIFLLNPIAVISFGILFSYIRTFLNKKNIEIKTKTQLNIGFFLNLVSFIIIMFVEYFLNKGINVSIAFSLIAMFIFGVGEFFCYRGALERLFFNQQSALKNSIGGLFFGTICVANIISVFINLLIKSNSKIIILDVFLATLLIFKNLSSKR